VLGVYFIVFGGIGLWALDAWWTERSKRKPPKRLDGDG
jgi:hypothetical protein